MVYLRSVDLTKLNSLTKYPSIPTYHSLDPKNGLLLEDHLQPPDKVIGTEKIDGTNARVICLLDGFILGSREELLYAQGDVIGNPALGIKDALKIVGHTCFGYCDAAFGTLKADTIPVFYFEVYGGKVTAASKQYTGERAVSYRLFDVALIPAVEEKLKWSIEKFSIWREQDVARFLGEEGLKDAAEQTGISLAPRLFSDYQFPLTEGHEKTLQQLRQWLPSSRCTLDGGAGGTAEGVVVRSPDRSFIAKLRFEDYERTIKRKKL